jgi:hypothetical protein
MHILESTERFGARARITICSRHAPIAQAFPQRSMGMPTRARRDQLGPRQFRGPFCSDHIAACGMYISQRNLAAILCCTSLRDKSNCGQMTLRLDTWALVPESQRRKLWPRPARVSGPFFRVTSPRVFIDHYIGVAHANSQRRSFHLVDNARAKAR